MMKKLLFLILLLSEVLILIRCKDDPQPNPCADKTPVEAHFTIGEQMQYDEYEDSVVVSDTVLTGGWIIFEASEAYDSCTWKIGTDPRVWKTNKVKLLFNYPEPQIEIKLTVKRRPLKNCFPDDDGVDTSIKYLTVIDEKKNPIFGEYQGSNTAAPGDVFKIQITHDPWFDQINILNINRGCYPIDESIGLRGFMTRMGYKKLSFFSGYYFKECQNPKGWFMLDASGKNVTVQYSTGIGSNSKERLNQEFKGIKIN